MTARAHLEAVVRWLNDLATISPPAPGGQELQSRIAGLASLLAGDFPPAAFSRDSFKAVARECKFFPSYAEVCAILSPWWRQHRPLPPLLPEPMPEPLPERTPEEIVHVEALVRQTVAALQHREREWPESRELPTTWKDMTRAELAEAYKRAGIKGPDLPKPTFRVVPAHNDA